MSALERLQSILSNRSSILEDREENENDIMTEEWFITGEGEQTTIIQ